MSREQNCLARLANYEEKLLHCRSGQLLLLALGSNESGSFGAAVASMCESIERLSARGIAVVRLSSLYRTRPVGGGRQSAYFNAMAICRTGLPPAQVLRTVKQIEREAGRRRRGLDRPRPLDIDIIASGGAVIGWRRANVTPAHLRAAPHDRRTASKSRARGWLTVPHPLMHARRFVLVPLVEIAPHWHHPVRGLPARRLLAQLMKRRGDVERIVDSDWDLCQKSSEARMKRGGGPSG